MSDEMTIREMEREAAIEAGDVSPSYSLLPCPFCGGEARLIEKPDIEYNAPSDWDAGCTTRECFLEEGAEWYLEKEQVIKLWNKRNLLSDND